MARFIFTATSLASAVAPTGPVLVAVRLLQGIAAGGGVAIGRAVVGDTAEGVEAARRYSTLAGITFLAPIVAPAAGGAILAVGSWRTVFLALAAFGVVMLAATALGIPETLRHAPEHAPGTGLGATWSRMAGLLRDSAFMRLVGVQCLATAGFFVYIGGSSFVLETVYGMSASAYAALFAVNAAAMAVMSGVMRLCIGRVPVVTIRNTGLAVACAATIALSLSALVARGAPPLMLVEALLVAVVGSMGLVIPATLTMAQEVGRRTLGTAAALQGGLAFLAGAAVTPLTGLVGYSSVAPMSVVMATFFLASVLVSGANGRPVARQVDATVRLPDPDTVAR